MKSPTLTAEQFNNMKKIGNCMSAIYFQLTQTAAVVEDPVISFVLKRHEHERVSLLDQTTRVNAILKALDTYELRPTEADMLRLLLEHHRKLFIAHNTPRTNGITNSWVKMTDRRCHTVVVWRDGEGPDYIDGEGRDVPVGPNSYL